LSETLKDLPLTSSSKQPARLSAGLSASHTNGEDLARVESAPSEGGVRLTVGAAVARLKGDLLERGPELDALDQTLATAAAGEGGIAFIEGATGGGKSRLIDETALLGEARGMHVLTARGRHLESELPFGVALQLFENCLANADESTRAPLLSGSAALAEPLLAEGVPSPAGVAASLHGLYWLSANLAERQPLLLMVDDVHWCDRPSLRFLLYLAQRINELKVAAVFAAPSGLMPDHDPLLDELRSHPATSLVRPQPFGPDAVNQRLRERLQQEADPEFATACYEVTGGNPFLLDELALELASSGVQPHAANAAAVRVLVPESVASAVLVRLRRLGKGAPELALAVSTLGDRAELRHAAELAGLPVARAAQIADALLAAGVLEHRQGLSFVHPVVGRALGSDRPEFDRAEAHRKAAVMLMSEGAVERAIPHLLAARPDGNPRAVEILMHAGETALRGGAPESAIRFLRRALDEPPTPELRPDVLLALGRAEGAAGAPEAIPRLTGALDLIGNPASRAAAALDTGRVLMAHGRFPEAEAAFKRGIEDIGTTHAALRAQLDVAYDTVSRLDRAVEPATPPSDLRAAGLEHTVAGRILLARAASDCAWRGTSAAEVRELATRALAGGRLLEDETCDGIGLYLAIFALVVAEDLSTAELAASTAVDDAQSRGSVLGFATASYFRSLAVLRRGRIADSAGDAVSALSARRYGWNLAVGSALSVRAECHLEAGNLEQAARVIQIQRDQATGLTPASYRYAGVRGQVHLLAVSPEAALADLLLAGRLQEERGGGNPAVFPWRSLASSAALALGDVREARRLAEEELGLAAAFGAAGAHGRALGALASTSQGSEALEIREEAVRILESSQAALERARALLAFGSALRRVGQRRAAREPLRLALDLAGRCGAGVLAKRARDELVALGARPRRDAATGCESLTARERQVAGLAAQGMSNREIAEALFVTIKTVEWHLRHTYEKLGVRSRRQLGRALAGREASSEPD
jgi:DNA-binding CsgD family transcriptional regulator